MNVAPETTAELKHLRDEIKRGTRIISLSGLTSIAAKAFVLSKLQTETRKTFVVVADSNEELETWESDLNFWQNSVKTMDNGQWTMDNENPKSKIQNPKSKIESLPSMETDVYAGISPHAETLEKRALTLWNLSFGQTDFVVTSGKSLITKTLSPAEMQKLGAILKRDEDFPPDELLEKLASSGYVREEPIKNIGEFSLRGGIIDVWSPDAEYPVRIEFFGDTVDSIRQFDAESQLSISQLKETRIVPMRPFSASAQDFKDWAFFARERFADEKFTRNLTDRTQFADEGEDFSGWEFLIPIVSPRNSSVFDFLKECIFVFDEPAMIEKTLETFYESVEEHYARITEQGEIGLEPDELFLSGEELREKLNSINRIELRALGKTAARTDEEFQAL